MLAVNKNTKNISTGQVQKNVNGIQQELMIAHIVLNSEINFTAKPTALISALQCMHHYLCNNLV